MTTEHVYIVGSSLEDDRPEIDYTFNQKHGGIDWSKIGAVLSGSLHVKNYAPVRIAIKDSHATNWDFYRCSGTRGLISARAASLLRPFSSRCFDFLDAYINDLPYFFLRVIGSVDCLDRDRSAYTVFPHDPTRIMWIERYAFHKTSLIDPCLFVIADINSLIFGTEGLKKLIEANNLHGFRFVDAEADEGSAPSKLQS